MTRKDGQSDEPRSGETVDPRLHRALRRLYGPPGQSPMNPAAANQLRLRLDAEWDRLTAPAAAPRRHVGPGRRVGGARRWGPVWVRAAAASIALAAAVGLLVMVVAPGGFARRVHGPVALRKQAPATAGGPAAPAQPWDIDGSGRVNMVDAFVLARAIAAEEARGDGSTPSALWDVTGDGVVDSGDVDAVAMRAVRLDGGGNRDAGGAG